MWIQFAFDVHRVYANSIRIQIVKGLINQLSAVVAVNMWNCLIVP